MLQINQELLAGLASALDSLSPGAGAKAAFESPKVAAHGDFASTAAMQLAKPLKLNPRQLLLAQPLPHSLSALSACYIEAPERFDELATKDEGAALTSWIDQLEAARPGSATAREDLLAVLEAFAQHNRFTAQLHDEARQHRKEAHQIGPQDQTAARISAAAYRELALKWMAPPVSSSSGGGMGYGDPADLIRLDECEVSDGVVDITAVFRSHAGSTRTNRYRMVCQPVGLSARRLWRIKAIWSVWPHEEIQLV